MAIDTLITRSFADKIFSEELLFSSQRKEDVMEKMKRNYFEEAMRNHSTEELMKSLKMAMIKGRTPSEVAFNDFRGSVFHSDEDPRCEEIKSKPKPLTKRERKRKEAREIEEYVQEELQKESASASHYGYNW